jgi:hypothetical protein
MGKRKKEKEWTSKEHCTPPLSKRVLKQARNFGKNHFLFSREIIFSLTSDCGRTKAHSTAT